MTIPNKIRVNFVRRSIPRRGPFLTKNYNASMEELSVDLTSFGTRWNTDLYPILNSLPKGTDETRWLSATNMPNPLVNGLDGDNFFVDNAASLTQDDGLFWNATQLRPKTVRESSRDLDTRITTIYTELSETLLSISNGLSQDQWNRLGMWVKDGTSSLTTSIAYKSQTGWTRLHQLLTDIYENGLTGLNSLGSGNNYTIEEMLSNLLAIHAGAWNTDTSTINHSAIINVAQTAINASLSYTKRARSYSPDANNTQEDLNRIRYEIAHTRWGNATNELVGQWNTSVTDPVGLGVSCLNVHINYKGNGIQDLNNPHGLHRQDIDALDTEFSYNNTFIGKIGLGSETPVYSSENYITSGNSLVLAISTLDTSLDSLGTISNAHIVNTSNPHTVTPIQIGATIREVYSFASHTDITLPIIITHNKGVAGITNSTWPIIQVIDTGIGSNYGALVDEVYTYEQEQGIITADAFVSIEYIDANTFHIYTNVINGKIITIF